MHYLNLDFSKKDYPYQEEVYDPNIYWGEIILFVSNEEGIPLKEIFNLEWDLKKLVDWIISNKNKFTTESISLGESDESIATKIFNFYNDDDCFDEDRMDEVYQYRQSHGFRFGLRGTDIADVYIGLNGEKYEISFCDENDSWQFYIFVVDFINKVKNQFGFLISE